MTYKNSVTSWSKAAQGLFVLPCVNGIFTVSAISPSLSLRQLPNHYPIRAGRNLPDKEFRYLRTVIVTAAVHQGFISTRERLHLTFWHWAGVSPYTSSYELARTCVFDKQLLGIFRCALLRSSFHSELRRTGPNSHIVLLERACPTKLFVKQKA